MSQKTWFGMEIHPSDDLVHWKDSVPKAVAANVRSDWDLLATTPEKVEALKRLIRKAQSVAVFDETYNDGEC